MMNSSCPAPVAAWRRWAAVFHRQLAHQLRAVAASALCLWMAGCASTGLDPAYQAKSGDAIIVLGTEGASHVTITPGHSDGTTWSFFTGVKNRETVTVRDGFVVIRLDASAGDIRYGVYQINNTVVQSANIATFAAEAGTVTYIGTLSFKLEPIEQNGVSTMGRTMLKKWNPEAAAEYMRKYYPDLAPKLRSVPAIEFQKNKFVIF